MRYIYQKKTQQLIKHKANIQLIHKKLTELPDIMLQCSALRRLTVHSTAVGYVLSYNHIG